MTERWAIIVEAPHVCVWPEEVDPPCDMRTDDFARRLHVAIGRLLERKKDPLVDLFLLESDIPRRLCDNNRPRCSNTDYRKRLRKLVARYAPRAYVLDVHSFGDDYNWLAESRAERRRPLPLHARQDIVLLDSDADRSTPETTAAPYVQNIAQRSREKAQVISVNEHASRLRELGFDVLKENATLLVERRAPRVYILAGSQSNDIMVEMRDRWHVKCILIEFRQGLTGPSLDAIIEQIAIAVVDDLKI